MTRRLHLPVCIAIVSLLSAGRAPAQPLYPRGDATCNGAVSAADLVATLGGLGDASACGNDDCDRDGAVTPADLACATGCLFDACPVPEQAPRVGAIAAESAPTTAAGSVVLITTSNLGESEAVTRVTVGGEEAEVVEQGDGELLVALPADLLTGPAEVVVFNDDVAGPPFTLEIAPPEPVGAPDTFDGTLQLLDDLLAKLPTLDLETVYGDAAGLVRQQLARARQTMADQRAALAADATLSAADRLQLDASIDASGAPEMVRALLAELDAAPGIAAEGGTAGGATLAVAIRRSAKTIRVVRGAAQAAAVTLSAPAIGIIATAAGIMGGVLIAASDPATPLIFDIVYRDADGGVRANPTGGGTATISGARFDSFTTSLTVQARGTFAGSDASVSGETISYRLPDVPGFCGKATLQLVRTGGFRSNPVVTRIQPELVELPGSAKPGEIIRVRMRGANYCTGSTTFAGRVTENGALTFGSEPATQVPLLPPDPYFVSLEIEGLHNLSAEDKRLLVTNPYTGMTLACPATIDIGGPPLQCTATLMPDGLPRLLTTAFLWTSSERNKATIGAETQDAKSPLVGRNIGESTITARLSGRSGPLASSNPVVVTVRDNTAPRISIASDTTMVQPGATLTITVTASDNHRLVGAHLTAFGDAVESGGEQDVGDCLASKTCSQALTVKLKERDFTQSTVVVQATASDLGANNGSSNILTFTIATDERCPIVTFEQPVGTVNAGAQVLVVAHASDNQPNDTGVTEFLYEATGPALVAPASGRLPLPGPQPTSTLRFPFSVKPAAELSDVEDLAIRISVTALDGARHSEPCGASIATVNVIGVLDTCNGGIQVDRPAGYIGESFTITVGLVDADEVVRVTSINPAGQFDLQPQGGGVYTVTLFYQGTGSFTLRFVAFDADGNERCSGSIGLESLGPKPEEGVAALRRSNAVAGGGRR